MRGTETNGGLYALRSLFPFSLDTASVISAVVFLILLAIMVFVMSLIAGALYYSGVITSETAAGSVALEFAFLFSVLAYLSFYKKMGSKEIISAVGLGRKSLTFRNVGIGVLIFAVMLILSILISVIGAATNTQINTNSQLVLASEPLWFYVFSFTLIPLFEELMFRAFMVPRLGIIVSALIFGLSHASYDSTFGIEMIAAFIFALIAGTVFKKTKSLYPSIVAHALVNALAVMAYVF